jgi:hypothetical protein
MAARRATRSPSKTRTPLRASRHLVTRKNLLVTRNSKSKIS